MSQLLDDRMFPGILIRCESLTKAQPEWLTPKLFCALARKGQGDTAEANRLLGEYKRQIGPAYNAPLCNALIHEVEAVPRQP